MTTIHMHANTRLTPEQFISGLTDFGPGRCELFSDSDDDYLEVLVKGENHAFGLRAPAVSGSGCTTTGRIPAMSS